MVKLGFRGVGRKVGEWSLSVQLTVGAGAGLAALGLVSAALERIQ